MIATLPDPHGRLGETLGGRFFAKNRYLSDFTRGAISQFSVWFRYFVTEPYRNSLRHFRSSLFLFFYL